MQGASALREMGQRHDRFSVKQLTDSGKEVTVGDGLKFEQGRESVNCLNSDRQTISLLCKLQTFIYIHQWM